MKKITQMYRTELMKFPGGGEDDGIDTGGGGSGGGQGGNKSNVN